jgi:hypothetical protein
MHSLAHATGYCGHRAAADETNTRMRTHSDAEACVATVRGEVVVMFTFMAGRWPVRKSACQTLAAQPCCGTQHQMALLTQCAYASPIARERSASGAAWHGRGIRAAPRSAACDWRPYLDACASGTAKEMAEGGRSPLEYAAPTGSEDEGGAGRAWCELPGAPPPPLRGPMEETRLPEPYADLVISGGRLQEYASECFRPPCTTATARWRRESALSGERRQSERARSDSARAGHVDFVVGNRHSNRETDAAVCAQGGKAGCMLVRMVSEKRVSQTATAGRGTGRCNTVMPAPRR